jgi:hypothetical protein
VGVTSTLGCGQRGMGGGQPMRWIGVARWSWSGGIGQGCGGRWRCGGGCRWARRRSLGKVEVAGSSGRVLESTQEVTRCSGGHWAAQAWRRSQVWWPGAAVVRPGCGGCGSGGRAQGSLASWRHEDQRGVADGSGGPKR